MRLDNMNTNQWVYSVLLNGMTAPTQNSVADKDVCPHEAKVKLFRHEKLKRIVMDSVFRCLDDSEGKSPAWRGAPNV